MVVVVSNDDVYRGVVGTANPRRPPRRGLTHRYLCHMDGPRSWLLDGGRRPPSPFLLASQILGVVHGPDRCSLFVDDREHG